MKLAVADFGFTDPNDGPADRLTAVTITTLPTSGTLLLNGQWGTVPPAAYTRPRAVTASANTWSSPLPPRYVVCGSEASAWSRR